MYRHHVEDFRSSTLRLLWTLLVVTFLHPSPTMSFPAARLRSGMVVHHASPWSRVSAWRLSSSVVSSTYTDFNPVHATTSGEPIIADQSQWKRYLVEFRGILPNYRFPEFKDALELSLAQSQLLPKGTEVRSIEYETVIPENISPVPVVVYVKLPNDNIARQVAQRCCLIRNIVEVWGDGDTPQCAAVDALQNYHEVISPVMADKASWRVLFNRHGREGKSGLDNAGKGQLLDTFTDVFKKLEGVVDLNCAKHDLVYIEDWHTYLQSTQGKGATELTKPLRCLFGRIVGKGRSVNSKYELQTRPYVGTTSMKAVNAHVAANFAKVKEGDVVLDPFCGTGSTLIPAAYLGGKVIGTDTDEDSLLGSVSVVDRSKNSKFRRKDGSSQLHKCVLDNFVHYDLEQQVEALFGADANEWLDLELSKNTRLSKYLELDAIISDPPFGRREQFVSTFSTDDVMPTVDALKPFQYLYLNDSSEHLVLMEGSPMASNPLAASVLLLQLAATRLKTGGRLVFWLPTVAGIAEKQLATSMEQLRDIALSRTESRQALRFVRCNVEELSAIWRWLVVFEKT